MGTKGDRSKGTQAPRAQGARDRDAVEAVEALAAACQRGGVTHLRLRRGPVAEMVILPAMPEETPEEREERKKRDREEELYGKRMNDV